MSAHDKFAHVAALRPARKREALPAPAADSSDGSDRLAQLLGAQVRRNHYGEHLSVAQWFATPETCVLNARSLSLLLPPQGSDKKDVLNCAIDPDQWLFLDTETTGLAGGTGTYPFLVGIAWWDAGGLQVEQFFMRDLDEEHSLLLELAERMVKRPVLVTFNGKSFDWPLLETRYRMTRAIRAVTPKAHLDLLHPARQLWRLRLGSVRLKDLERHVLGGDGRALDWTRHDDIDSSLIPQFYFDYLRGGPAEPLAGIFHHNRMDLRGLAVLAGKIFTLLDSGNGIANAAPPAAHDPVEVLGLSRMMHRRGHSTRARELYESALLAGLPRPAERLAQTELALLAKRELDYTRAASLWDDLRKAPKAVRRSHSAILAEDARKGVQAAIEAAEQLAIYYEHRVKQPQRAAELVRAAIKELGDAQHNGGIEPARAIKLDRRLAHRLARLERRAMWLK
ncbi:MAG: ribonuclease H-like domain-containing protein [Acidobacteriia bacterium]|nr:ribonuclease H-like domain-containing protein [Terriglobia bacterium]